ncbi:MAG: Kelch repeat-containing protein [Mangrovibacterium sp.]
MILKNFFSKRPHVFAVRYCALALAAISLSTSLVSCGDDDDDLLGNWVALSTMNGSKRTAATGTTVEIDGKEYGFVGTGMDSEEDRLVDFWRFDPSGDTYGTWIQIADFPGIARTEAVSFSINGILYVGTGFTDISGSDADENAYLKDFYKYDPATDTWTQIDDLPTNSGGGIKACTAFVLGDKAYVGLGADRDNEYKDFYVFNGATETWESSPLTGFPGDKLTGAASFVIGDIAYVGAGSTNGSSAKGFFSFDGTNWRKLHVLTTDDDDDYSKDDDYDYNIVRNYTATFVMDGKGYFATAGNNTTSSTVWEYRPESDKWVEKTEFEGSSRNHAVGLTINGVGYVTTGGSSGSVFDDIWRFEPSADQSDSDN